MVWILHLRFLDHKKEKVKEKKKAIRKRIKENSTLEEKWQEIL